MTDIALQEGEQLVGPGPVAAGDTVRWIIGDTVSGAGPTARVHILAKPTRPDISTNLVVNTDRRTYHLELRATPSTYMASVSWSYPQDRLIALRGANAAAALSAPIATGLDIAALNFRYWIEGDRVAWRPARAFDDGRQVFIEFAAEISQGEMPPLFVTGAAGDAELVNYRVQGRYMVVDRLFASAERRLGDRHRAARAYPARRSTPGAAVSDPAGTPAQPVPQQPAPAAPQAAPQPAPADPRAFQLRGDPPRVMRLSRKALAALGAAAGLGIGGALLYARNPPDKGERQELYGTEGRATAETSTSGPKDYSQVPKRGAPLPGDLGRPILSAQQRGENVPVPPMGTGQPDPRAQAAEAARQRAQQERDAARTASLFLGSGTASGGAAMPTIGAAPDSALPSQPDGGASQGDQAGKRAFWRRRPTSAR